jgi:hypothetical protein
VQEAIGRVQADIRTDLQITPVAPDGEEQAGAPIRSNGRRYEQ